ncbi:hypothetical protein FRB90_002781 [Tulasnella sp. 427]|nr:hypothetical protein FRB90_002781 [Tulasnella sp. 427]
MSLEAGEPAQTFSKFAPAPIGCSYVFLPAHEGAAIDLGRGTFPFQANQYSLEQYAGYRDATVPARLPLLNGHYRTLVTQEIPKHSSQLFASTSKNALPPHANSVSQVKTPQELPTSPQIGGLDLFVRPEVRPAAAEEGPRAAGISHIIENANEKMQLEARNRQDAL